MTVTKKTSSKRNNLWTEDQIEILKSAYANGSLRGEINLKHLEVKLGRLKSNICRKARQLGLTNHSRAVLPPDSPRSGDAKFKTQEERSAHQSRLIKERIQKNGHPRGALGLRHTKESREKMSNAIAEAWANKDSGYHTDEYRQKKSDSSMRQSWNRIKDGVFNYSRTKKGRREDVGPMYFRSSWEANYARFLNLLKERNEILSWEFEKHTFWFHHIKRGVRSYTPDFRVVFPDGRHEWHEVKGWMDAKSKTKIARMGRCYPDEKLVIIDSSWFRAAKKSGLSAAIKHWES